MNPLGAGHELDGFTHRTRTRIVLETDEAQSEIMDTSSLLKFGKKSNRSKLLTKDIFHFTPIT